MYYSIQKRKGVNMNIKSVLKKEGITNIRPLDILTINKISKNISHKLYETLVNII